MTAATVVEKVNFKDFAEYYFLQGEYEPAQVAATMHLAQQTRLNALLEALGDRDWMLDEGWLTARDESVIDRIKQRNHIRAQIREGLGVA